MSACRHPPLYERILELAESRHLRPTITHHFVLAEEALPLIAQSSLRFRIRETLA
jgi:hypothetical protein